MWNRTPARCQPLAALGAMVAANVDALFAAADRVIIMLANARAINDVLGCGSSQLAERVCGKFPRT